MIKRGEGRYGNIAALWEELDIPSAGSTTAAGAGAGGAITIVGKTVSTFDDPRRGAGDENDCAKPAPTSAKTPIA